MWANTTFRTKVALIVCSVICKKKEISWWRHKMEEFSALLALYAENSLVTCEFPSQRPVTRSFDVFFDLRLNERLSKQSWPWWFETPSRPLGRHCNARYRFNAYVNMKRKLRHGGCCGEGFVVAVVTAGCLTCTITASGVAGGAVTALGLQSVWFIFSSIIHINCLFEITSMTHASLPVVNKITNSSYDFIDGAERVLLPP